MPDRTLSCFATSFVPCPVLERARSLLFGCLFATHASSPSVPKITCRCRLVCTALIRATTAGDAVAAAALIAAGADVEAKNNSG